MGDTGERLAARMAELAQSLRAGHPLDPAVDLGPLISPDAAALVARRIADAAVAGAKLLCGGKRDGALVTPAVLDRVPSDADLVKRSARSHQ